MVLTAAPRPFSVCPKRFAGIVKAFRPKLVGAINCFRLPVHLYAMKEK